MKESGIEWIGDIPKYWEITPLFTFLDKTYNSIVDGPFGSDMKNEEYVDEGIPVIQLGAIRESGMDFSKMHYITEEKADSLIRHNALPNDIAIAKMMPAGKACEIPDTFERYVVSADVIKASVSDNDKRKFLIYALNSYASKQAEIESQGSTRARISISKAKKMKIACPSISDISSIVKYLDEKCNEIDSISDDIRKEIETLQEYRKSVITEAVTKGLDPNVEMKDSGVEWIGNIPAHWTTIRMKYLGRTRNGLTYKPSDVTDESGTLVLRSSNIQNGKLHYTDTVFVSCSISNDLFVKSGDILICSRNGSKALIGKSAIIDQPLHAVFGAFMMIFRTQYNSRYMYYLLNSGVFNYYLGSYLTTTINQLTSSNFEDMIVPFCNDMDEQELIARWLDSKCSEIDSIISDKQKQLDTLAEYRKSLIYEYVTGKKEVV